MSASAGLRTWLRDEQERTDLIAYLALSGRYRP
jgi:hypothetical protein